jgi:RimJ/RimL family protein N-acetyltransferase
MSSFGIVTEMPVGVIRQLRPSDLPRFREHLLRLDLESRRDRFNGPSNDAFVAAYAERAFRAGTTVIGYVENDVVLGAAELHEIEGEGAPTGEIAFSVEKVLQHRGIGSKLFQRLIWHAHALGYTQLRVTTHPQNQAMKKLASKFNARLRFEGGETVGMIELEPQVEILSPQVMPQPGFLAA